ncbi:MAG: glycerophosphodiester phosphodiesterase family protein [Opitutaceae bacterium]
MQIRIILLLFICLISAFAEVKVVAHRGASAYALENTLAAFQLAWDQDADAIEADFRLTKDGHIICIHDSDTKRVADKNLTVEKSTLSELQSLELVSSKSEGGLLIIPTMSDVLATIPSGKQAFLEIKSGVEIVDPFVEELRSSELLLSQIVIISFNEAVLSRLSVVAPEYKTLLLVSLKRKGLSLKPSLSSILEDVAAVKARGASLKAHPMMSRDFGEELASRGYEFHVWTVDSPEWAIEMVKRGAQSITTNKPDLIKAALHSK